MLLFKLIVGLVINIAVFGGLLFVPAGTWEWRRAWVFLGTVFVSYVAMAVYVFPGREDLLNERFKPPIQKGQPLADKVIVILFIVMTLWLESYAAALLASVPIGTLALRIPVEERFLRRELKGYDAYTERVRYRLIPFLW